MAVYTQWSNEKIAALLERSYGLAPLACAQGIAQGVENSNYLLTVGAGAAETNYILTLYEKRVNPADLPFFLELMQHVARGGVACPQPIVRRDGALFGIEHGKQAALVSFLHGQSRTQFAAPQVAAVGETLGAFHCAAAGFAGQRANTLSLAGWQGIYAKLAGRLDEIEPGLEALVHDELDYLAQHMPQLRGLPAGVIHADLFPDNVFFEGDAVSGIIDFYFACVDALAYDVAIALNAWCFDPQHHFSADCSRALLSAYQKKRVFAAAEVAAFPTLLRGAAMRFLLTRAHDWLHQDPAALVRPHDPREYAAKLRFHQQVKAPGDYGL
ncbi:MAG: homoserine kinase [Pseudomonadota bacterium]